MTPNKLQCPRCEKTWPVATLAALGLAPGKFPRHVCLPRFGQRATNYVRAAIQDAANERERRTPEQVAEIREICRACEKYDAAKDVCRLCKCPIGRKKIGLLNQVAATISGLPLTKPEAASEHCPLGKW